MNVFRSDSLLNVRRNIGFIVMGVLLLFVSVGTAARLLISGCSKSRSYGTLHR